VQVSSPVDTILGYIIIQRVGNRYSCLCELHVALSSNHYLQTTPLNTFSTKGSTTQSRQASNRVNTLPHCDTLLAHLIEKPKTQYQPLHRHQDTMTTQQSDAPEETYLPSASGVQGFYPPLDKDFPLPGKQNGQDEPKSPAAAPSKEEKKPTEPVSKEPSKPAVAASTKRAPAQPLRYIRQPGDESSEFRRRST